MRKILLKYHLDILGLNSNNLLDIDYSTLSFLNENEPTYSDRGEKISKVYTDSFNKKVVEIKYSKIIKNHEVDGVIYQNTFKGVQKTILYYYGDGTFAFKKTKNPYIFNLDPINDLQSNIVGYTSLKGEQILRSERSLAELKLKSRNPLMYNIVYTAYKDLIEDWKATGDATALTNAIDNETDTTLLEVFNKIVEGTADTTVGDYIKYVIS